MTRRICVVTGSRAEYGLLQPLLSILKDEIELQLVVTGTHLSLAHGATIDLIESDGFEIADQVDINLADDSAYGVAKSLGEATILFADTYRRLRPDLLVVLGDRYEVLAAAQSALILGIPIAHLHGGEVTNGAFDDSIRHAITKFSNIHFVAAEEYKQRVIQLGETPETVFNFGSLGVQRALNNPSKSRTELGKLVGLELRKPLLLVTYHPTTRGTTSALDEVTQLLSALNDFQAATIVFTGTNADPENSVIDNEIRQFVMANQNRSTLQHALGQTNYLNLVQMADVVIGNSSSGIIEAPALHTPTVNIGPRQDGRLRAESIIDVPISCEKISQAIRKAVSVEWQKKTNNVKSLYGSTNTAELIADTLKQIPLSKHKKFCDLQHG